MQGLSNVLIEGKMCLYVLNPTAFIPFFFVVVVEQVTTYVAQSKWGGRQERTRWYTKASRLPMQYSSPE
jgi:hypothetical protein